MRTLFKFILLNIFILACSSTKNQSYFDENNTEISQQEFNKKKKQTIKFLSVAVDSVNYKLTTREKRGTLTNISKFIETLEKGLDITLEPNKPIAIVFYPGKDECNSTINANTERTVKWHNQLKEGLQQIAQTNPLYIYKDSKGLENHKGLIDWKQDPNQFIENLFFKYHYPCNSFVVVSSKGDYISYFGEFPKEFLWEAAKILK